MVCSFDFLKLVILHLFVIRGARLRIVHACEMVLTNYAQKNCKAKTIKMNSRCIHKLPYYIFIIIKVPGLRIMFPVVYLLIRSE